MRLFFRIYILTVIFDSISLASTVHSLESEAVNSDTLFKGLARSTFDAEVIHHTVQPDVLKENDTRQYSSHPINSFPYCVHGRVQTTFKLGGATLIRHGSGILIGPSHVVTAGHNLYKHDFNLTTESGIFTTPVKNKWTYEATFSPLSEISTSEPLHI